MRLSLRFVIPLLLALAVLTYAMLPLVDRLTVRWFERDLEIRANLIANTVEQPVQDLIRAGDRTRMLLRVRERRPLAALPHRPRPSNLPDR